MNIGSKIRALRIRRNMTQQQLAGDKITRNMLSRIENGAAMPSLGSLLYISERLEVSPAFFFEESERPQSELESMLCSLYNEGKYEQCISAGSALTLPDIGNILAQCYLNIAVVDFLQMKIQNAREALLLAKEQCESTADITDTVYNIVLSLLRFHDISIDTGLDELSSDSLPSYRSMAANFYLFLLSNAAACKNAQQLDIYTVYGYQISARAQISAGNYKGAFDILKSAEDFLLSIPQSSQAALPHMMLYMLYEDLELCATEIEDYKEAYEITRKKQALSKSKPR